MEINEAVQRMALYAAQMYYHLTHEMVQDYGEEAASATIARAIHEFGLERGRNIRAACLDAGEQPTIRNLDRFYDMPISAGWSPERGYTDAEDGRKTSCTKSCTYADYWLEKDWAKIGKLYCAVDPAIREGYNDNICYTEEKNILDGDEYCASLSVYKDPLR